MMKLQKYIKLVASGWGVSRFPFGSVIFSWTALPFLLVFYKLFVVSDAAVFLSSVLLIAAGVVVSYLAVHGENPITEKELVLDKFCGIIVAFLFVPVWIKLMVFGFILFHLISFLRNFVQLRGIAARVVNMPGVIGVFADDIIVGILVNVFLHLMIWIVH